MVVFTNRGFGFGVLFDIPLLLFAAYSAPCTKVLCIVCSLLITRVRSYIISCAVGTYASVHTKAYILFPLRTNDHPAVRVQALPGNKTAFPSSQKHKARCDLARLSRSSYRACKLLLCLLIHRRWDQGRPDWARTYAIYPDSSSNLLV
jgi:hypothetical protein